MPISFIFIQLSIINPKFRLMNLMHAQKSLRLLEGGKGQPAPSAVGETLHLAVGLDAELITAAIQTGDQ